MVNGEESVGTEKFIISYSHLTCEFEEKEH